jgi:hypothetical protein
MSADPIDPNIPPGGALPPAPGDFPNPIMNQPGIDQIIQTLTNVPADVLQRLRDSAASVIADLPPNATLSDVLKALSLKAEEFGFASKDLQTQFESIEDPSLRQVSEFLEQQKDFFADTIVTGLVAMWTMASVMNDAIASTQQSQILTQKLQEEMTSAGLAWSKHFSEKLEGLAERMSWVLQQRWTPADKANELSSLTADFNKASADSQAASSFTSGLTNSVNNAISSIVQAIQIDMQNIQGGVQKLFDTIAQFT